MSAVTKQMLKLLALGLFLCAVAGVLPIYLRAIDNAVVHAAGTNTRSLDELINDSIALENPGAGQLLIQGAQQCEVNLAPDTLSKAEADRLTNPELNFWGGVFAEFETVFVPDHTRSATVVRAFVNRPIRRQILEKLLASRRPGVKTILENRELTGLEIFLPAGSAGGAPLDSMILSTAQLSQADTLNKAFRLEIENLAGQANRGHPSRPVESLYLDCLAFASQMDWSQYSAFMARIESSQTLRRLSHALASHPDQLPTLFSLVLLSPSAAQVANYLHAYPETGLDDLRHGLRAHSGGLASILGRQERVYQAPLRLSILRALALMPLADYTEAFAWRFPWTALLVKYIAILLGAFCLIRAVFVVVPKPRALPAMLRAEGIATQRQQVLALAVLGLFILLGEPFLAQNRQTDETPINWKFPTAPAAVVEQVESMMGDKIDELTLLALVVFFLIQAALYAMGLVKLKELAKQQGPSRLKLKLLDNEDNMFDAGLYVGLAGTVVSLLILTLNLAQIGLMAAYASTLFGIVFVSLLKIIHVRPYRRKLLIESEAGIL